MVVVVAVMVVIVAVAVEVEVAVVTLSDGSGLREEFVACTSGGGLWR